MVVLIWVQWIWRVSLLVRRERWSSSSWKYWKWREERVTWRGTSRKEVETRMSSRCSSHIREFRREEGLEERLYVMIRRTRR
jgi:hypothetical protein